MPPSPPGLPHRGALGQRLAAGACARETAAEPAALSRRCTIHAGAWGGGTDSLSQPAAFRALKSGCAGLRAALRIRVVSISKTRERWAEEACDDYAGRVRKFGVELQQTTLRPAPGPPVSTAERQKEEEGRELLSQVDPSERLVVLDERGALLTSHELAELLREYADDGIRSVTFAIGGASGHSPAVRARASVVLSLSKMVMNHQIARVVLLEQLYRAYTILRGVPYHK